MNKEELEKLTVKELKQLVEEYNLKQSRTKKVLIKRLLGYFDSLPEPEVEPEVEPEEPVLVDDNEPEFLPEPVKQEEIKLPSPVQQKKPNKFFYDFINTNIDNGEIHHNNKKKGNLNGMFNIFSKLTNTHH